jgi:hypothetical protein
MGSIAKLIVVLLVIYVGAYAAFRQVRQEVRQADQKTYVIFPSGSLGQALYVVWRPLTRADKALTGIRTHIGPHPQ